MDNFENTIVPRVNPIRGLNAKIYERDQKDQMYKFKKMNRGPAKRSKKNSQGDSDNSNEDKIIPAAIEQTLLDYKNDLKQRLSFDRAMLVENCISKPLTKVRKIRKGRGDNGSELGRKGL